MVIGSLADGWDGEVINMLVEVLVSDVRHDTVIDVLTGFMVGVDVDMLDDMEIVLTTAVVITLDFVVSVSYIVDVLSDLVVDALVDVIVDGVSDVAVDVSADVNVKVLATVMTALTFVAAPSEEVMYFF